MTANFRFILFIYILGSKGVVLSEKVRWATKTLLRGCVCSGTALVADYEIATGHFGTTVHPNATRPYSSSNPQHAPGLELSEPRQDPEHGSKVAPMHFWPWFRPEQRRPCL